MSRSSARAGVLLALAAWLGTGCGPTRAVVAAPSDEVPPPAAVEDAAPPSDSGPIRPAKSETPAEEVPVVAMRRPLNILALSGGGQYGAYTAGILAGWSRTNSRPEFDVVTGISSGALMAPLAFLGPKYDADMRTAYTEVRQKDVFALRSFATIPFRDAVASSAPLRRMVESAITDDVIAAVAAEHRKGRRLYVGTTHLEGRRSVVWDLGAIAVRGGKNARKTFCDILVASCSVPGVFPPVPIEFEQDGQVRTELHVDGGVTTSVFVPPQVLEAAKSDRPGGPEANLYVLVSGKYYPEAAPVRPKLVRVIKASGGALLRAHTRRDLSNLYHMAKLAGVKYHSMALRQDFAVEETNLEFDQAVMNRLYVEGVKVGLEGPKWHTAPPERGAGEADEIRTGVRERSPGRE